MELRLIFSPILCVTSALGFLLAAICFRRRRIAGAREFAFFIAACAVYAGGYVGELWGGSLSAILAWIKIEYLGIAFIPSMWIVFVKRYTGQGFRPAGLGALVGISAAFIAVVLTIPAHDLYYVSPRLGSSGPFPAIAFEKGPLYWLMVGYQWISLFFGEFLLARFIIRSGSFFKAQAKIIFSLALLPFIADAVYVLGLIPLHIDPTPATFPLFAIPIANSLLRFHFLDIMPIARERVMEALSDAVVVVDIDGRIVDSNSAAGSMLGLGKDKAGSLLAEATREDFGLDRLLGSVASLEFCVPASNEGKRLKARSCLVSEDGGRTLGTVIMVADVTETARLMSRLDALANTDDLTGLDNRRRFYDLSSRDIEHARRAGRSISVCLADLDDFKAVNDRLGHEAGDAILREAAARLSGCMRAGDLLCRFGGDEFAVLFPECDAAEGIVAAERLQERLASEPASWLGTEVALGASFGLCSAVPEPGDELEDFLRKADEALYRAKGKGRNRVESWR